MNHRLRLPPQSAHRQPARTAPSMKQSPLPNWRINQESPVRQEIGQTDVQQWQLCFLQLWHIYYHRTNAWVSEEIHNVKGWSSEGREGEVLQLIIEMEMESLHLRFWSLTCRRHRPNRGQRCAWPRVPPTFCLSMFPLHCNVHTSCCPKRIPVDRWGKSH